MSADINDESPLDANAYAWPSAPLDPVARLRALAAGLPHVAIDETVFDVEFDRMWSFIEDFEQNTPRFEGAVGRARIIERRPEPGNDTKGESPGERIVLDAKGPLSGPWIRFDVVLRPGWCLMSSRFGDVGMAARPEPDGRTRFVHFEGTALTGGILKPIFAWNIRQDFRRLRRLLGTE